MSLDEVLQEALGLLRGGVTERGSPFRTLILASGDADGTPDVRTVVLRGFDPAARTLAFHTDARSAKVAQLQAQPVAALLGWDAGRRLQIRLRGRATLRAGDAVARAAWDELPPLGRQLYRVRQTPGATLPSPAATHLEAPDGMGFAVFMVVEIAFDRLETLLLGESGQVRARFDWTGDAVSSNWLVP